MHVAIVTRADLFPPVHGAAVRTVRTAEALAAGGVRVSLVTEDRDGWLEFRDGAWSPRPFPPRIRAAEEWPPLPRLARLAERLCARVGYPPEEGFLYRPMFDPAWWLRVAAVGALEGVDIFQAEFPGFGVPALVAARLLRRRAVVVEHNVEHDRLRQMAGLPPGALARIRRVELGILGAVDDVVAVSAEDRDLLVRDGVPAEQVTVIPHGVDLARHDAASPAGVRARLGVPPEAPLLFFHGVLHYHPNAQAVRTLVADILPRLLPRFPDLRLVVAGMSPPAYYAHPAVTFPGVVDDLPAHVAAADVCVCPLESGGGTRLKLLEYFAGGRAVVSTAKGAEGLRVRHGEEQLLAEGPDAFAEAVARLLEDPARRRGLGRAARQFAGRYGWDAVAGAHRALYGGEGRGQDWNDRFLAAAPSPLAVGPRADLHDPTPTGGQRLLLLLLNRECNLRCAFCDLPGQGGRLDMGRLPRLLDEARAIGTTGVVLTGGEPFLHPHLFQAVAEARQRRLSVNVTTNGTLVAQRWGELLGAPPDSVSVSLDGLRETHDALRRAPGTWDRAVEALRRLRAAGIHTEVLFTLTRQNVGEVEAVWRLARELGAGFDFWPVNGHPELALRDRSTRDAFQAALARLAAADPALAARRRFLEEGLRYHAGEVARVRCLGLVDQYGVTPEGDLLPCCQWGAASLRVGNVFETPLPRLWHSEMAARLRHALRGEGCAEDCWNHSLHAFTQATGRPAVSRWRPAGGGADPAPTSQPPGGRIPAPRPPGSGSAAPAGSSGSR